MRLIPEIMVSAGCACLFVAYAVGLYRRDRL